MPPAMKPRFFKSQAEFRSWLEENHDQAKELLVGFYKKGSGKGGITYSQALDEALCFGWIDGVRKSLDDASYTIRFTPRKPGSIWSAVNIEHVRRLTESRLMKEPGLRAFQERDPEKSKLYSYEQRTTVSLEPIYEERFKANDKAWSFFQAQPPWYRRVTQWWIMSAKKEETRARRLAALVESSERGERLAQATPGAKKEKTGPG